MNPGQAAFWLGLVVLGVATIAPEPAKRALHNPTLWQHGEASWNRWRCLSFLYPLPRITPARAPHDLKGDPGLLADLFNTSPSKSPVPPDMSESWCLLLGFGNCWRGAIPLLDRRCLDLHGDRQSQCVYDREPLPSFDFLARIESAEPPFSVVLTD